MFNIFSEIRDAYDNVKNMVEPDRPQITLRYFASWITKAADTYSE
jgi:hypothetical protein